MNLEKQLDVKLVEKNDSEAIDFLVGNSSRNSFDPKVLGYPASILLRAGENGTAYGYMPAQTVVVLESLGLNPEVSEEKKAQAVMNLVAAATRMGVDLGAREIMFLASDPVTARGAEAMGFEKVEMPVYRLKVLINENHDKN